MPLEVLHQIQYLCKLISKVEWSGALFYTTEGSIEKPGTFKITLKTILPLDMGTQAYTEYNLDNRFMDFIEEDFEERCTWKLGHIHSHNSMAVFFSGTDMAELNDNAPAHNFYLSLIVNNAMDFMAKVAFIGEAKKDIKQVPYTAKNIEGNDYVIETQDFEVNSQKLFIYDCEIATPLIKPEVDEKFAKQVAKIMEPKPKPIPASTGRIFGQPNSQTKLGKGYSRTENKQTKLWDTPTITKPFEDWGLNAIENELDDLAEYDLKAQAIYDFAKAIFNCNMSAMEFVEADLEDVIDDLFEYQFTPSEIAKYVIDKYAKIFSLHFPDASSTDFIQYTHELLDLLEDIVVQYPELKLTIKTITSMIEKFITHETERHNTTE